MGLFRLSRLKPAKGKAYFRDKRRTVCRSQHTCRVGLGGGDTGELRELRRELVTLILQTSTILPGGLGLKELSINPERSPGDMERAETVEKKVERLTPIRSPPVGHPARP